MSALPLKLKFLLKRLNNEVSLLCPQNLSDPKSDIHLTKKWKCHSRMELVQQCGRDHSRKLRSEIRSLQLSYSSYASFARASKATSGDSVIIFLFAQRSKFERQAILNSNQQCCDGKWHLCQFPAAHSRQRPEQQQSGRKQTVLQIAARRTGGKREWSLACCCSN